MKNSTFLLKAFVTIVTMLSVGTSAFAHDFVVDGIYYNITNGTNRTVEVTSRAGNYSGAISVPSSVTYNGRAYSVTEIGDRAFYRCTGLTSVTIPNSVTSIGESAFSGCSGLPSITIPNSVTTIGNGAFDSCSSLTNLIIKDGTQMLSLGYGNPYSSSGHKSLFYDCPLNTLYLGRNLSYDKGSSYRCYAFYNKTSLKSVTISDYVTTIGNYAFYNCTSLTSVTIPNSVTKIGDNAFSYCEGLTEVAIPNSVTSIGGGAFSNCTRLTEVNISDLSAWCNIEFSSTSANPLHCAHHLYLNGEEITDLVIPDDITEIKNYAFSNCYGLTEVAIGDSVTSIGDHAFSFCDELTKVKIGKSVTSIGISAFRDCTSLTMVTMPDSVTSIGDYAFYGCEGLELINIPNSTTFIGKNAFGNIGWTQNQEDGILYLDNLCIGYKGKQPTGKLIIKDGTRFIYNNAFMYCTKLTEVVLPNSMISIGQAAFFYSGLTSINIPDSVTSIGQQTFESCTKLTSINIPNSIIFIAEDTFYGCTSLTSVTIPNSVTTIGKRAFSGCSGLKEIVSLNPEPPTCSSFCFYNVPTDCILKVPAGAKEAYSAAVGWSQFTNIIEIATVEVSTQGDNATFEIPTAVDAVKYTVKVYSDAEMTQLIATANYDADGKIMPMSTSLELSIDGFADGTYYYSVSALSDDGVELENHTGEFVINVATGIENVSIETRTTEVARYDIYGRLLSEPTEGINIVKMSDGTTRKLIIKN